MEEVRYDCEGRCGTGEAPNPHRRKATGKSSAGKARQVFALPGGFGRSAASTVDDLVCGR